MKSFGVFLALLSLSAVSGQVQNINCNFLMLNVYTCGLTFITIPDNENLNIVIGGQHMAGRSNADVVRIDISGSTIPFIIAQLFTTFPNVERYQHATSLTRVQTNAFAAAGSLTSVVILFNEQLTEIQANAFNGASNLRNLDLGENSIAKIHETAFNGLTSLTDLYLDNNDIGQLHHNVFRPLSAIQNVILSDNQLTSLDGRLFQNNPTIRFLELNRNQINAVGREFLDGITALQRLSALSNVCVNSAWRIEGTTTIDTILQGLSTCFSNSV